MLSEVWVRDARVFVEPGRIDPEREPMAREPDGPRGSVGRWIVAAVAALAVWAAWAWLSGPVSPPSAEVVRK